jgi:hypothetical protein
MVSANRRRLATKSRLPVFFWLKKPSPPCGCLSLFLVNKGNLNNKKSGQNKLRRMAAAGIHHHT